MILITGASGNVGSAVLEEIRKSGQLFRAMYRSESDAAKASEKIDTVIADFADKESLFRALDGVDSVYLVCSPVRELVELESNVIDASLSAGVKHIVLNSALGAADYPKSFPAWHRRVEDKLRASGLSFTILRPNSFMQNIVAFYAPSIRASGAFYGSYGNARISFIHIRDIAAAVGIALTAVSHHAGKIYELNGPEAVTCAELAQRIAAIVHREVNYVDIPEAAQRDSMLKLGMPEWQVEALLELQRYYANGQGGEVDDVLSALIGRPLITLDEFLHESKQQFEAHAPQS